jgi:hypothetical protein
LGSVLVVAVNVDLNWTLLFPLNWKCSSMTLQLLIDLRIEFLRGSWYWSVILKVSKSRFVFRVFASGRYAISEIPRVYLVLLKSVRGNKNGGHSEGDKILWLHARHYPRAPVYLPSTWVLRTRFDAPASDESSRFQVRTVWLRLKRRL